MKLTAKTNLECMIVVGASSVQKNTVAGDGLQLDRQLESSVEGIRQSVLHIASTVETYRAACKTTDGTRFRSRGSIIVPFVQSPSGHNCSWQLVPVVPGGQTQSKPMAFSFGTHIRSASHGSRLHAFVGTSQRFPANQRHVK